MFVLLVLLSFFVFNEIDQVLKGKPKWYEKSAKRNVYYKGSFETGSSKVELLRSPDWKFLNTLWICNRVNAKCYPDIFFRWRNKIQSSSLPWILCSRWQPRSKVFARALNSASPVFMTHALLPIFPEESWALEWIRILVEGQTRFENGYVWTWKFLNPERNSCGFKNIRIRVEGVWMNAWMACYPVSLS